MDSDEAIRRHQMRLLTPVERTAIRDLEHLMAQVEAAPLRPNVYLRQPVPATPGPQPLRLWVAHRSATSWGCDSTAAGARAAWITAHQPLGGPVADLAYDRVTVPPATTVEAVDAFVQRWLSGLYAFYRGPGITGAQDAHEGTSQ